MMNRQAIYTAHDVSDLLDRGKVWNFHAEDTREHLHTLHPYPAKFIPQIPRLAIERWSRPGDLVYDPFCGCGTTLLEATLLRRDSVGSDNNAVAVLVSRAKVATYTHRDLERLAAFHQLLGQTLLRARLRPELVPTNKNFPYWYSDGVVQRLAQLKGVILQKREPLRSLLLAIFSSILVRVSFQDSDTRYARIARKVSPSDVDAAFGTKLEEVRARLPELIRPGRGVARVFAADSRQVPEIRSASVDLLVTSPPYLNAYDYHKYHRQRLHWIEGDVEFARDREIGSHDEFTRSNATPDAYFQDMDACFQEWSRVLKPGARAVIVIGDAIVSKQPVRVADTFVSLIERTQMRLEDRWIRELQATKRSFNVRNSRISHEHVLLFRKR